MNTLFTLIAAALFAAFAIRRLGIISGLLIGASYLFNSVSLRFATTMISDLSFAFLMALALWACDRVRPGWIAFTLGVELGLMTLVRVSGAPVALAVLLGFMLQRRWKESLQIALGGLLVAILGFRILLNYTMHGLQVTRSGIGAFPDFVKNFLVLLGGEYLGLPPYGAVIGMVLILALAIWGWVSLARSRQLEPWALAVPFYLVFYALWPILVPRYMLPLWPLLLILAALALKRYPLMQLLFLILVLICPIPGLIGLGRDNLVRAKLENQRFASYAWLRQNAPQKSVVWSMFYWRIKLLTGCEATSPPNDCSQVCELIASICRGNSDYVVYDPFVAAVLPGASGFRSPPRADLWFDRSTHLEEVFSTKWDKVYRWRGSRESYLEAFRLYLEAAVEMEKGELTLGEKKLRESMRIDSDIPEARALLAWVLLQKDSEPSPEALELLESNVNQYPSDMASAFNLALAYRAKGKRAEARALLKRSLSSAREWRFLNYEQAFSRALQELEREPSR